MNITLILLATSPWAMPAIPPKLPTQQQIMARVAKCGLSPPRATISPDQTMGGEDVVRIGSGPAIGARQTACLARASTETFTFFLFADPEEQRAFFTIQGRMDEKQNLRTARRRLKTVGLLKRLPRYDPARQSLDGYIATLEALCGVRSGQPAVTGPRRHWTDACHRDRQT